MIDRMSRLVTKSRKDISRDEVSVNAQLLERGGFVSKLAAGIYSYLPLGLKVLTAIEQIVREEMNATGAEEVLMAAMVPKASWEAAGRWSHPGTQVQFQLTDNGGREFGLGFSHEEVVTPLVAQFVRSYRDVPKSVYQIQTKFRDEPRAKSGLLRGREFRMKDMYSFHLDVDELSRYYEQVVAAYLRVFSRVGLDVFRVKALGGIFSPEPSDEFSVEAPIGEDTIFRCDHCDFAENKEVATVADGDRCPRAGDTSEVNRAIDTSEVRKVREGCRGTIRQVRGIEVGNIFRLGAKYSESIGWTVVDQTGAQRPVIMGCYGIGMSRVMGAIVELHHDERGIIWPASVAPYAVHVVNLTKTKSDVADDAAVAIEAAGLSVLYDDRADASVGQKLADADLIGIPVRVVVSERTVAQNSVEVKARAAADPIMVEPGDVVTAATKLLNDQ